MENRAQSQSIHTVRSAWNTYARISRGIVKVLLIGLAAWMLTGIVGCMFKDDNANGSTAPRMQGSVSVTAPSVKHPEKFRYFFVVKNISSKEFVGLSTEISLQTQAGKTITSRTFPQGAPFTPNQTHTLYIDANTGPASVHGEDAGIYQFTARTFDKESDLSIATGTISQEVIE